MEINKNWSHKIIMLLSVSIIANIFLIGILIGQHLRRMPFPPPHHGDPRLFVGEEFKKIDEKIRSNEKQIEAALLKEPYDKQAVLNALEKFDEQMKEVRNVLHQRIADEAAKLPPTERLKLLPGRRGHPMRDDFMKERP